MSLNVESVFNDALASGLAAAEGHASDLREFLEARARLVAEGVAQLAQDRLDGLIDDEDVKFAFEEIKASEETAVLAIEVAALAAAQDAINAVLSVATAALNSAIGIPLL